MALSALDILCRSRREVQVEDLLFAHPELIAPGLPLARRQVWLSPQCRADLLFESEHSVLLVEIKRGIVTLAAVNQVKRYRRHLKLKGKQFSAFLVGSGISPDAAAALKPQRGVVRFLQFGTDIPKHISLCRRCRLARDLRQAKCPYCGSQELVQ